MFPGGIVHILAPSADFVYDFDLIELYGGAHVAFTGEGTTVKTLALDGDDTGYVHIAPGQILEINEVI